MVAIGHVPRHGAIHITGAEGGAARSGGVGGHQSSSYARILVLLHQGLGLPPWSVLVVRMLLHVQGSQSLGLINEGSLLCFRQQFPLSSKTFADLAVVHLGVLLSHLPSLSPTPDHECIHRPLDSVGIFTVVKIL